MKAAKRIDRVHANYAGAGIASTAVLDAITSYLALEREMGPYEAEIQQGETVIMTARTAIGRLLGCARSNIALFENATRAWTSLVTALPLLAGDTVWVSEYDYAGNLFVLTELRRRTGINIVVIPLTPGGDLDLDWCAANLTDDVALVCVSHIPSCCGSVVDVTGLGSILDGARALFAVDGCQAVGNIALDVADFRCDMYTGAGRKFLCGPRGTGFAFVSDRYIATADPAILEVHAMKVTPRLHAASRVNDAADLELAERNIAVWSGLGVAVEEALACTPAAVRRRHELFAQLENEVCDLPGLHRLGDAGRRAGILSVTHDRLSAMEMYTRLLDRGINTWRGVGEHTPLFASARGADEFLRISIGRGTTATDADRLVTELAEIVKNE